MPRYRVRLDDPNSDEFRILSLTAESPEAARVRAQQVEQKLVDFKLAEEVPGGADGEAQWIGDYTLLKQLLAKEAAAELTVPGHEYGLLHAHRQSQPYQITDIVERDARKSKTKARKRPKPAKRGG